MITSTWGTPNMVKDGVNPELLLSGKYGNTLRVWDLRLYMLWRHPRPRYSSCHPRPALD